MSRQLCMCMYPASPFHVSAVADDVRASIRPLKAADLQLARYLTRWPKQDVPFEVPPWQLALAERVEAQEAADTHHPHGK